MPTKAADKQLVDCTVQVFIPCDLDPLDERISDFQDAVEAPVGYSASRLVTTLHVQAADGPDVLAAAVKLARRTADSALAKAGIDGPVAAAVAEVGAQIKLAG